jgi:hypothetical protein
MTTTIGIVGGHTLQFKGPCDVSFDDELNVWAVWTGEGDNETIVAAVPEDKLLYWYVGGTVVVKE